MAENLNPALPAVPPAVPSPEVSPTPPDEGGKGGDPSAEISNTESFPTSPEDPPTAPTPEVLPTPPIEGGEGGAPKTGASPTSPQSESGVASAAAIDLSNADFLAAVFQAVPANASAAICSKPDDPNDGGWTAISAEEASKTCPPERNNYFNCSTFHPDENGTLRTRKNQFAACHALLLDDIGGKVPRDRLSGIHLSWLIETSPGNYQGGLILAAPLTEGTEATQLLDALIHAGLCDPGASGPMTRWARLPEGINGKPKYRDENGVPFQCRLDKWNPDARYTPEQITAALNLPPPQNETNKAAPVDDRADFIVDTTDDVYTPRADENPVISELKKLGLYKTPLGSGKHDVTCPWVDEHTDQIDHGAAYFEPDDAYPLGGFCCQHSHRDRFHISELLDFLDVPSTLARNKPCIRVVAGDMHRVIEAAEKVLAEQARHYQAGGLIVSVVTDAVTSDPSIVATNSASLAKELSIVASWEKYDGRSKEWVRCDPPSRHTSILYDAREYQHLPALEGVVRQPYFHESNGELVMQPGYDAQSRRFGVFDTRKFELPEPTLEAAQSALHLLEELLAEFAFVSEADKAAALSAIFTAVTRPSLPHAPAFHVRAPVFGSGKTYLCELVGYFAGPAGNLKVSYPKTAEEATKAMLALLLTSPGVIEFDDMDSDWIPHGTINSVLTSTHITGRILGFSKTATVATRTLVLGSGNNVGPVRDLLRRVLTIHLDPRTATPATRRYRDTPVEKVRNNRGQYVSAVLTVIQAWKAAGSPRADVDPIATYNGAWTDYCRHPLLWLGQPDPATALLDQLSHDPDAEALGNLLLEWHSAFGSTPTTVRKAVNAANGKPEFLDALREFPVEERGEINRSKLGWILKKNANRIINRLEFQKDKADGRVAWRVVKIDPEP